MKSITYNGVTCKASSRRSSDRSDKKFMRTVSYNGKERVVHYGDPNLSIKRTQDKRRESFNARHNCKAKKDPFSPGFWSCYEWKKPMENMSNNTILVELGRPFDGLAAGTWTDMYGRELELPFTDFQEIVSNTKEAIESTRTASGDLVGLPIDQRNHEKSDAAGFIIDVELVGEVIMLTPRWNSAGEDLIKNNIYRAFSATYNPSEKVILGGSLVNWPALTHRNGKRALRPIELGNILVEYAKEIGKPVTELTEEEKESAYQEYMEETDDSPKEIESTIEEDSHTPHDEVFTMEMTKDELLAEVGSMVRGALAEMVQDRVSDSTDEKAGGDAPFDFSSLFDLEGAADGLADAYKSNLAEMADAVKRRTTREYVEMLNRINRESNIKEFASVAVNGNNDIPVGIPVDQAELASWLTSLNDVQLDFAKKMIEAIRISGTVEFREYGHERRKENLDSLPAEYQQLLDDGLYTVKSLKEQLSLGDNYDFSKWEA